MDWCSEGAEVPGSMANKDFRSLEAGILFLSSVLTNPIFGDFNPNLGKHLLTCIWGGGNLFVKKIYLSYFEYKL